MSGRAVRAPAVATLHLKPSMPPLRKALAAVQPLFLALAFVLMGLLLVRHWDGLRAYQWQFRPLWLAASGLCVLAGWLVEIFMWRRGLGLLGGRLDYRTAVQIWFASAIVRYIPGNVWQPLSMTVRCGERGIPPQTTLASLSLFLGLHLLAACPITALYLATWGRAGAASRWLGFLAPWWSVLIAVPVLIFLIRPRWMLAAANRVLARVGLEPLPLHLSSGELLGLLGTSLAAWAFLCGAFTALAGALAAPGSAPFREAVPHVAFAYPIAYAIGFLSLLTPSGLGVREGILVLLLAPVLGSRGAIVAALGMRAWEIGLEMAVTAGVVGLPWLWSRGRHPR